MNHSQLDNSSNPEQVLSGISSKHIRRAWLVGLALTACIGGLSLLWVHFHSAADPAGPMERPQAARPAPSTNTAPSLSDVSLALRVGDRLVYRFHQHRSMRVEGSGAAELAINGAPQGAMSLQLDQDGDLVVKVYEETAKGWLVGFSIENGVIETTPKPADHPHTQPGRALRAEILAFIQKSGKFGKMTSLEQTSEETLGHWKDILSRWQTVLAEKLSTREWNETEEDAIGPFAAEYIRDSAGPPAVLRKTKRQYLSIRGAGSAPLQGRSHVFGATVIQLNPYPVEIEGQEQLTMSIPEIGGTFVSDATYSLHLQSAASEPDIQAAGAEMARKFQNAALSFALVAKHEVNGAVAGANVDGTTIEEQIGELAALHEQGLNRTTAELKALEKIVGLIKKDDAAVDAITRHLSQHAGPAEGIPADLIGMLGAAGTPKAQQALIGLAAASEWPMEQRRMGLFSFVQVTEPVVEADDWLRQMHQRGDELSNSSLLVLAAMGNRVREQDPERYRAISEYVVASANNPDLDLQERIVGLDAIGNLGPQEVPKAVLGALASDDQLLRTKALLSLERVVNDPADQLIQNAVHQDAAASVRIAAVGLLSNTRRVGGFDDLSFAATKDPSEDVRLAAVSSVGEWTDSTAKASQLLQQISEQDSSKDVRDAAAQLLRARMTPEIPGEVTAPE